MWEASPHLGRWFQGSLLVPSSLVGPLYKLGPALHPRPPAMLKPVQGHKKAPMLFSSLRPCLEIDSVLHVGPKTGTLDRTKACRPG